jgi:rod shape-determining protein MreC
MAFPDIRYRVRFLFVAVMVGHILLISSQVNSQRGVSLLDETLTTMVVEAQRAAWTVVGGVRNLWRAYADLRDVKSQNEYLIREVVNLRVQLQQQRALTRGTEQLRSLLDLRTRLGWNTAAAEVIAGSTSPEFHAITIDKGRSSGVTSDMAVIAPEGIVGRVVEPSIGAASVQLLIDQNAAASVMVERSSSQGIALGVGDGTLHFEYLSAVSDVQQGDVVVTAGLDGVYPKGLPVGQVSIVERSGLTYRRVVIVPYVDFSSLEAVLVVLTRPEVSKGLSP